MERWELESDEREDGKMKNKKNEKKKKTAKHYFNREGLIKNYYFFR